MSTTASSPVPAALALRAAAAVGLAAFILAGLGWLLARLVWLWFSFGLFFFLLAGLLTGALVFPIVRPCRPVRTPARVGLCVVMALLGWAVSVSWEYRFIVESAGDIPHFAAARNALVRVGKPANLVVPRAAEAFEQLLRRDYPPGGVLGYVRWAIAGGRSEIELGGLPVAATQPFRDHVAITHHGWRWPLRAAASVGLLFLGLWWQLAALRDATPTNNLIDPDEADEMEMEEAWEAGEPGFRTFDHTADVGLEVRGKNWRALLEQSVRGLMATIGALVPDSADRGETVRVTLSASTREELLHDWLAEMVYCFETRRAVPDRIRFLVAEDARIEADVTWRRIDDAKSRLHREVKAVTYHELTIKPWKRGWTARVILDI